ncbi:fungal protease inhibitor F-like isoform X1 [Bombyx mori]|uniref:TIL domain-containing protein n=2 Tax=Bombyx mori TaxID=7091 RepID=A0A8R1WIC0_BOMMO|nr:fungal protease inhibitor F-like [Bombyx mori]
MNCCSLVSLKLESGWTDLANFSFKLFVEVQRFKRTSLNSLYKHNHASVSNIRSRCELSSYSSQHIVKMAAKHYFIMFLLVSLMALAASKSLFEKSCPENAHTTLNPCVPTCADPELKHTSCVTAFIATCHCDSGYLFNSEGKCVPVAEC